MGDLDPWFERKKILKDDAITWEIRIYPKADRGFKYEARGLLRSYKAKDKKAHGYDVLVDEYIEHPIDTGSAQFDQYDFKILPVSALCRIFLFKLNSAS